jgi:sigma-E factor negative regulatory protein RseB
MFTDIRFLKRIPEDRFEPGVAVKSYKWHTVAAREHRSSLRPDPAWHIGRMPPGFTISENIKRTIAASVLPVQHIVSTDGLASVSVFIAKPDAVNEFFNGSIDRGALHARALNINRHQVTVVGEVPEITVQMIGESIEYRQGNHD